MTIGTEEASSLQLAGDTVAPKHARIDIDESRLILTDEGSIQGTFLNGEKVTASTELQHRDIVRVGAYRFMVDLYDQEPERAMAETSRLAAPSLGGNHGTRGVRLVAEPKLRSARETSKIGVPEEVLRARANVRPISARQKVTVPLVDPEVEAAALIGKQQAWVAMVCGFCGMVAFIPAIALGHMAQPAYGDSQAARHKLIALILGYGFLGLWIAGIALYFSLR